MRAAARGLQNEMRSEIGSGVRESVVGIGRMLPVSSSLRQNPQNARDHWYCGGEKACLQIRRLVSGLPSDLRAARAFGVFQVVIDDSGRGQERDPAFVLAGYIARVRNWKEFADRWQAILAEPPALGNLKGYEAYWLCNQFKGWTPIDRDKKLSKLISLIHKYAPLSVTLAVNGRAFDAILRATKGSLRNIYPLAVAAITTKVLSYRADQRTFEKLGFIFDQGMLHGKVFEQAFEEMMTSLPKPATRLIGKRPHMEDDLEFLPLQAADLLASYVRFKLAADARGEDFDCAVWKALCDCAQNLDAFLTTDALLDLRRRIEQDLPG